MADGYLEQHQQDYEARRDAYLRRQRFPASAKGRTIAKKRQIERPDDEAL